MNWSTLDSLIECECDVCLREFIIKIPTMTNARSFTWCSDLHKLSEHFPLILKVRKDRFPSNTFFHKHWEEEVGHSDLLLAWMQDQGIPLNENVSSATDIFITWLYQIVQEFPENTCLILINACIERLGLKTFTPLYEQIKKNTEIKNDIEIKENTEIKENIEVKDNHLEYWTIHKSDDEHSNVSELITPITSDDIICYIKKTCKLYADMLQSWIEKIPVDIY